MRTIPVALLATLQSQTPTIAHGLKFTRLDGQVFAFTSHDRDATISGVRYRASPGLHVSNVVVTSGAAVGNMEITTLHDGTVFTTADVLGGVWRNCAFTLIRYDYTNVAAGVETLLSGIVGEVQVRANVVVAELRDLRQYLQTAIGSPSSKTCRARLGDSKCRVPIESSPTRYANSSPPYPLSVYGTVNSRQSNQVFADFARNEPDDWFGNGILTWTSGLNSGISVRIKTFARSGSPTQILFTLSLPMLRTVAVGDKYYAVAGCRGRIDEDCIAKFGNVLNFQGEPHRPSVDDVIARPDVSV